MGNEEIRREAAYRMEQLGLPQWVADDFMKGKLYVNDMMFYGHGPFPLERMAIWISRSLRSLPWRRSMMS